jgi:hypothetical protein
MGLRAAWVLTCVVLVAASIALIVWRGGVMRTWPPSGRILALFDRSPERPAILTNVGRNDRP